MFCRLYNASFNDRRYSLTDHTGSPQPRPAYNASKPTISHRKDGDPPVIINQVLFTLFIKCRSNTGSPIGRKAATFNYVIDCLGNMRGKGILTSFYEFCRYPANAHRFSCFEIIDGKCYFSVCYVFVQYFHYKRYFIANSAILQFIFSRNSMAVHSYSETTYPAGSGELSFLKWW